MLPTTKSVGSGAILKVLERIIRLALPAAALFFMAVYGWLILGRGYHQTPANYADHAYCESYSDPGGPSTNGGKPKARVEQQGCQPGQRDPGVGREAEWEAVHAVNRSNELAITGIEFGRLNALLALIASSFAVFAAWYAAKAADEAVKGNAVTAETLRAAYVDNQPRLVPELKSSATPGVSSLSKLAVRNVGGGPAFDATVRYATQSVPFIQWNLAVVPWLNVEETISVPAGKAVKVHTGLNLSESWVAVEVLYSDTQGGHRRTVRVYESRAGSNYMGREIHEN